MADKIIGLFKGKKKAAEATPAAEKKGPIVTQLGTVPDAVRRRITAAPLSNKLGG